jgi:sigma54-dependent transcription regulator
MPGFIGHVPDGQQSKLRYSMMRWSLYILRLECQAHCILSTLHLVHVAHAISCKERMEADVGVVVIVPGSPTTTVESVDER